MKIIQHKCEEQKECDTAEEFRIRYSKRAKKWQIEYLDPEWVQWNGSSINFCPFCGRSSEELIIEGGNENKD